MAEIYLVCEGDAHSIDLRVLDKIVAQRHPLAVNLIAAGGDSGLNAVRAYHEEKSRKFRTKGKKRGKLGPPEDKAFSIQDRNFCSRQHAESTWTAPKNRKLMWRRHEIENYLIEPRVLLSAFNSYRRSEKWAVSLPTDESEVLRFMMDLARPRLQEHAGQLLRCKLDEVLKQACTLSLPNPGSSTRGWCKAQWLVYLQNEGQRIQNGCNVVLALPDLDPAAMDVSYDALWTRIGAPDFLQSGQFLEEMGGHELLSVLVAHIQSLGGKNVGTEELENELVDAIGREYQPGIFIPDDFAELANRIR